LTSQFDNKCDVSSNNSFYAEDVFVKDNWLYNHANKGIEVSGKWVVVSGNVNSRQPYDKTDIYGGSNLTYVVGASDGKAYSAENAYDFMSRFMDYGGWNMWFDNNRWQGTGSIGNDGESIMCQRHTGLEVYSVAMTHNVQGSTGDVGYIAPYDVHAIGLFHGWNTIRGEVGVKAVRTNYGADITAIQNFKPGGADAGYDGPSGTEGANVRDHENIICPVGTTTTKPVITLTSGSNYVDIEWTNADNEAAYKVERRKEGELNWTTVAFRPRQETGGLVTFSVGTIYDGFIGISANYGDYNTSLCWDGTTRNMNEPKWRDYSTLNGKFYYRVTAVSCDEQGTTADEKSVVVTNVKEVSSIVMSVLSASLYPNPAKSSMTLNLSLSDKENADIQLYDVTGKFVKSIAKNASEKTLNINCSDLKTGVYFLQINTSQNATNRLKFIKE